MTITITITITESIHSRNGQIQRYSPLSQFYLLSCSPFSTQPLPTNRWAPVRSPLYSSLPEVFSNELHASAIRTSVRPQTLIEHLLCSWHSENISVNKTDKNAYPHGGYILTALHLL